MATLLLVLVVVLVIAGLVFGVVSLLSGDDPGLVPVDPDGRARPLPNERSLHEGDLQRVRFDVVLRGYRMSQVDRVLRRTAYDLGYKDEMIAVLEAEVAALREGRLGDAEVLRRSRESAASSEPPVDIQGPDITIWAPAPADVEQVADGDDADVDRADVGRADVDRAEVDGSVEVADVDDADVDAADVEGAATAADEVGTDDAVQPELPREGSLRRRSIAEPESANGVEAAVVDGVPTAEVGSMTDRPAHA
jgi:DivIVA domain-containing protein